MCFHIDFGPEYYDCIIILSHAGEHIKNWRKRYFILRKDGSFEGFRSKPELDDLQDPLNKFSVKGMKYFFFHAKVEL